jgi:hypothetical protein
MALDDEFRPLAVGQGNSTRLAQRFVKNHPVCLDSPGKKVPRYE